ncbi:MAG: AEC family transporter [candidate division Zixibacteria bacterium]|nr:AEC family transporter [candidate division Zixibacteria bacterium]
MLKGYAFLLIPLLLGFLLSKIKFVPKSTASVLNFFVINIALPATILVSIKNITLSYDLLIPVAAQWIALIITALIVVGVSYFFKFSRLVTGTLLLVVPLGNTAFLGLSIIPVFFDNGAVSYGIMYDQLGSFLALATYGAVVASAYGKSKYVNPKILVVKVITFPPLIFLVIGFLLKDYSIPLPLSNLLSLLSKALVPAAMIAIGLNVSLKVERQLFRPLISALLIRLILVPIILILSFFTLGLTGLAAQVSVFQSAMPSMITAAVLASDKGLDKTLATSIVSIGLIISLATLPLIYYLIELILIR